MPADWQLVECKMLTDGRICYIFCLRAQVQGTQIDDVQTVVCQHPRADWSIAGWYSIEQVTVPESRKGDGRDYCDPRT